MASHDPEVRRRANRKYAQSARGQAAIQRGYETRLNKTRQIIQARKADGCQICGRQGPPYIFDFHHVDPSQKNFSIAKAGQKYSDIELVQAEMDKCVVLCAICHRMVEYGDLACPELTYKIIPHVA